ncbi:MAG: GNAT family N-acetyltransferase [Candidatus Latescibacteria bacterium]|jgi:GNAT superfamily N-acetyltransferase|nr:GNAT family N-acetyltransferase [Candidatus Latescibacterota bacterium]
MALEVTARECLGDADLVAGLQLKNEIFFHTTPEQWKQGEPKTASIAYSGSEVVGFIPLALRPFRLAPGVIIDTAFEHCVGTKEACRGTGVGTKMIEAAREFLRGRVHALCVYRGHERSRPYNFYAKVGHHDLHYIRRYHTEGGGWGPQEGIEVTRGFPAIPELGHRMIEVYEDAYARYGGYPVKTFRSWEKADNEGYVNFWAFDGDRLLGYLLTRVIGYIPFGGGDPRGKNLNVMEMAVRNCDGDIARKLLKAAIHTAGESGMAGVFAPICDRGPFIDAYLDLGMRPSPRANMVMSLPLDIEGIVCDAWRARFDPDLEIQVWTPEHELSLTRSEASGRTSVLLEMKEEALVRWVLGRLDFRARMREGTITATGANDRIVDALADAMPFTPWVYHHLDYI